MTKGEILRGCAEMLRAAAAVLASAADCERWALEAEAG
jgi:hypothetical protein